MFYLPFLPGNVSTTGLNEKEDTFSRNGKMDFRYV